MTSRLVSVCFALRDIFSHALRACLSWGHCAVLIATLAFGERCPYEPIQLSCKCSQLAAGGCSEIINACIQCGLQNASASSSSKQPRSKQKRHTQLQEILQQAHNMNQIREAHELGAWRLFTKDIDLSGNRNANNQAVSACQLVSIPHICKAFISQGIVVAALVCVPVDPYEGRTWQAACLDPVFLNPQSPMNSLNEPFPCKWFDNDLLQHSQHFDDRATRATNQPAQRKWIKA